MPVIYDALCLADEPLERARFYKVYLGVETENGLELVSDLLLDWLNVG